MSNGDAAILNPMADLPSPDHAMLAEQLGAIAGASGLPRESNPWRQAKDGPERVLHFRWRMAWAGARAQARLAD